MGGLLSKLSGNNYIYVDLEFDVQKVLLESPQDQKLADSEAAIYADWRKCTVDILAKQDGWVEVPTTFLGKTGKVSIEDEIKAFETLIPRAEFMFSSFKVAAALQLTAKEVFAAAVTENRLYVHRLVEMFVFANEFDTLRLQNSMLTNHFSFYGRLLKKIRANRPDIVTAVGPDEVSEMMFFTPQYSPMFNAINDAAQKHAASNAKTAEMMAVFCNACLAALGDPCTLDEKVQFKVATSMVGMTIVFDYVHVIGLFSKSSPVNLKGIVSYLKAHKDTHQQLLNQLHYNTKNFKRAAPAFKKLFEE